MWGMSMNSWGKAAPLMENHGLTTAPGMASTYVYLQGGVGWGEVRSGELRGSKVKLGQVRYGEARSCKVKLG